jgi:hypothetical protein
MTTVLNARGARFNALMPTVHLRFEGRSEQVSLGQLGLAANADDRAIKNAVANYLNVSPGRLNLYVVERHENGNFTVRPEAVYG